MKKEGDNDIKWLGFNLTKKRAYYVFIFGMIVFFFFSILMHNAFEVLLSARTIYQYDESLFYQIVLLGFSNLIISFIFYGICGYTFGKIRLFRKSLKIQ